MSEPGNLGDSTVVSVGEQVTMCVCKGGMSRSSESLDKRLCYLKPPHLFFCLLASQNKIFLLIRLSGATIVVASLQPDCREKEFPFEIRVSYNSFSK